MTTFDESGKGMTAGEWAHFSPGPSTTIHQFPPSIPRRELFAAMLAQGYLSTITVGREEYLPFVVSSAVTAADLLILELAKERK